MSATPSVSSSVISTTAQTIQYTAAARALLKRTESYTEEGLAAFLAARYPEVDEEHRHSLIIGATAGAQTAAQLYILLDGAKSGNDKGSQITTEGARRMLSFYNLGLMTENPYDPNPQIRMSPVMPKPSANQERHDEEEPEIFEILASQEDSSRKGERPPADEGGEDVGTSPNAIELVELEIPGTQPCNRPDATTRKRVRSISPDRTAYQAELWRKYLCHPTLDDRIQLQIEMDADMERLERSGENSQEIPPSPPSTKERKMELPLLLREPPPRGPPPPHIPATVTSAAAAAQRQSRPVSPHIKSFIPSGKANPGAATRTSSARPHTPRPFSGASSKAIVAERDTSRRRRSDSPRGRYQTSRSLSPNNRVKIRDRREWDRGDRR